MLPVVVSLGLKYPHSKLSVAGHSLLASESTISASLESHTDIGLLAFAQEASSTTAHNALPEFQQHACRHKSLKGRPIFDPVGSCAQMPLNQQEPV
jgi:hypothetical protein